MYIEPPPVLDLEWVDGYVFFSPNEAWLRRELDTLITTGEDKLILIGFGFFLLERSWCLCGMEVLYSDIFAEIARRCSRILLKSVRLLSVISEGDVLF